LREPVRDIALDHRAAGLDELDVAVMWNRSYARRWLSAGRSPTLRPSNVANAYSTWQISPNRS
jgi:hypothetical protein